MCCSLSAEIIYFTIILVPRGYPQALTGEAGSSRSTLLSWQPPIESEQNGVITSYTITLTDSRSSQVIQRTVPSSQTSLTVDSLLPFTTYSCSIAASTSVGLGPFSTFLSITTLEDGMILNRILYGYLIIQMTRLPIHSRVITRGNTINVK